jgi:hypothetical protein
VKEGGVRTSRPGLVPETSVDAHVSVSEHLQGHTWFFLEAVLSLSFELALEKRLVLPMHHYFWASIYESESHWEVQLSS